MSKAKKAVKKGFTAIFDFLLIIAVTLILGVIQHFYGTEQLTDIFYSIPVTRNYIHNPYWPGWAWGVASLLFPVLIVATKRFYNYQKQKMNVGDLALQRVDRAVGALTDSVGAISDATEKNKKETADTLEKIDKNMQSKIGDFDKRVTNLELVIGSTLDKVSREVGKLGVKVEAEKPKKTETKPTPKPEKTEEKEETPT
jgi:hypothetical protein